MTFNERADYIRCNADQGAIAKLLGQYPWGKDVGPRAPGTVTDSSVDLGNLSNNRSKRKAALEKRIYSYQQSLARSIQKHDALKRVGLAEVSNSDLMVCYSGKPLSACKWTMELHEAHISYALSILEILEAELSKLDESIPAGFILVDVLLTAHQAFQVRKWAEQAQRRLSQARVKARMDAITESNRGTVSD